MSEKPPDYIPPGQTPLCFQPEKLNAPAGATPAGDYPGARPEDYPTFDDEISVKSGEQLSHEVIIRFREIARLYSAGVKPHVIAQRLGYTQGRVLEILAFPEVKEEVKKFRNAFFDKDIKGALREAGPDFVKQLHAAVLDPALKPDKRAELARWGIEQLEGKARQQIDVNDTNLATFMQLMKQMSATGELAPPRPGTQAVIDVTPKQIGGPEGPTLHAEKEASSDAVPERNPAFRRWISENL